MKLPLSAQEIDDYIKRLRGQVARLSALAKAMQVEKRKTLQVNNARMASRGLNDVDDFIGYAERALRDVQDS